VNGRPNRRNKAAFSYSFGVVDGALIAVFGFSLVKVEQTYGQTMLQHQQYLLNRFNLLLLLLLLWRKSNIRLVNFSFV